MKKVTVVGIVTAILLAATEVLRPGEEPNYWVLVWSLAIAVIGYLARNMSGKVATALGLIGSAASAFYLQHSNFDIPLYDVFIKYVLPLAVAVMGVLIPGSKPSEPETE